MSVTPTSVVGGAGATGTVRFTKATDGAVVQLSKTTTITVTPGAPPAADVVRITKATWEKGLLTIEATSTNPNAILSVFGRTDNFMFTLTN